jgi:hypothetical protein
MAKYRAVRLEDFMHETTPWDRRIRPAVAMEAPDATRSLLISAVAGALVSMAIALVMAARFTMP